MAIDPVPIDIPPGVVKSTSTFAVRGRWIDTDKIRFVYGKAEKRGGWLKYNASLLLDGAARGGYGWTTAGKNDLLAFGTFRRMYSVTDSVTFQDITPLRFSGNLANPFTTTISLKTVTVHHVAHGTVAGAVVTFSGAAAVGGITINGEYIVTSVTGADDYVITHSIAASASAGPGGGATVATTEALNPGQVDTIYGTGFGAGTFGTGTWGTPRAVSTLTIEMRYWSICNYGTELLVCPSGDTIYLWDQAASAARAVALANAPATVRYAFVTGERFIMALGAGGDMTVKWPDVSDPTIWTPALANTANVRVLQEGNKLIAGCVFNDAVNLIWSDTAVYIAQYLPGVDFIYDIAVLRTPAGLLGASAFCTTPIGVFWLSGSDVLLYNGSVQPAPNFTDLRDWFFRMFRRDKAHKAVMVYNSQKNEVELHYASVAGSGENDSYIACSLDSMSWAPGTMAGTLGWTAAATRHNPTREIFAAHADDYVYQHEVGTDADTAAMAAYIESGPIALSDGGVDMDIVGYEPNFERQTGNVTLDVTSYDRPRGEQLGTPIDEAVVTIAPTDAMADFLIGGRYTKHRLTSNVLGGDFRLGLGQFEAGPAGNSR